MRPATLARLLLGERAASNLKRLCLLWSVRDRVAEASLVQIDDSQWSPMSPAAGFQPQRANYFGLKFSPTVSVGCACPERTHSGPSPETWKRGQCGISSPVWHLCPLTVHEPQYRAGTRQWGQYVPKKVIVSEKMNITGRRVLNATFPVTGWMKGWRKREEEAPELFLEVGHRRHSYRLCHSFPLENEIYPLDVPALLGCGVITVTTGSCHDPIW